MARFRSERYITQIISDRTGKWTFRVRIGNNTKTFAEKDYGDAASAFQYAKRYRDQMLLHGVEEITKPKRSVSEVFSESYELFPVRMETRRKLDGFFAKYIGCKDKDISKIRSDDILLDLNNMIEIATDDTIQRVFTIWKKIIKTALYKEYITKDYTMLLNCPKSHKIACFKVNKVTDRQSIIKMETLCSERLNNSHDRQIVPLLLEFLYLTGCRICEALALTKQDIKKDHILISKELGSSLTESIAIRQCKTELSNRSIPLTAAMKDVIKKASTITKSDILFSDQDGNYYDSTLLGDKIHKIGKSNGLDFNMYSIRHLFATDLVQNKEIDQRTRMELMGHSNIGTTLDYARSNDKLKINALKDR